MVVEAFADQAEGLRRLMAQDFVRTVAFVSGTPALASAGLVAGVARALAGLQHQVLVVDEAADGGRLAHALGILPRYDLQHALAGQRPLHEVLAQDRQGVRFLSALHGLQGLAGVTGSAFIDHFHAQVKPLDTLLVQTRPGVLPATLAAADAAQEVIVLAGPGRAALTQAYSLIKLLHQQQGRRRFRILAHSVRSALEGRAVFERLVQVAGQFLEVSLDDMGAFPALAGPQQQLQEFARLAGLVTQWPYPRDTGGSLQAFLGRLTVRRQ